MELLENYKSQLHYISDTIPGYKRVKAGKGFYFVGSNGNKITDQKIIDRIEKLVIPPAWDNVWISPDEFGHIQVTGIDEKRRKQYIYHPEWILLSQQHKFDKLLSFAEVLPTLRHKIHSDMEIRGLKKERILATIVWLLEHTFIRVGNPEYAKENNSYGLTTLRTKHVDLEEDKVTFEFKGKSGIMHKVDVGHPQVVKIIRKLEELPGYELFQFVGSDGNRHHISSQDVNEYLRGITGETFSAKDFRTWGGTVLSAETLYTIGPFETKTQAKKNVSQAVKTVARHLRNTPTVCRAYYIHPTVVTSYQEKFLIPHFEEIKMHHEKRPTNLSLNEYAVSTLLLHYAKEMD